jgi:hypothetical protein
VKAGGGDDERVARGGERGVEGPDGKTVYFWSYPDNGLRQVRRGTEDQNQELPGMTRPSCPGCWAIVGNSIYYVDGNPETRSYVVKRYDLKSQRNTELKPLGSNVAWDPWSFAVSPDGKYVLYGQMDRGNTDLMLIEGFR